MSSMQSKLEAPAPSVHTPARRKLSTLRTARGFTVLRTRDGLPELVRVDVMEGTSAWQRIEPGADGLFQLAYTRGKSDD